MNGKLAVALVLGALLPVGLVAQAPDKYLEVIKELSYSDGLYPFVWVSDRCPVETYDVNRLVEDKLHDSGLFPTEPRHYAPGVLVLHVALSCHVPLRAGGPQIFDIDAYFGYYDETGIRWKLYWDYSDYGTGDAVYMTQAIEGRIEDAITDFIRAHTR